jgi:hypothetical protein
MTMMTKRGAAAAVALGAALAGLPAAPAAAATNHQSNLQCSTSGYFYRATVFYSITTGQRLSVNRVEMSQPSINGAATVFYGASVTVRNGSGAVVHYNATGGGFNRASAVFYWPDSYHVSTRSAPMRVQTIAEYPNRTRLTCNGSFWA